MYQWEKVWNSRIKVQSGCIANTNVALTMPSVDCICDITITIHWLSHKHRLCNIKVYPESIKFNTFYKIQQYRLAV